MASEKTIVLKGIGVSMERVAAATITPGDLIELTSANKFQRHSSAGQNAQRMFATEDELQGNEVTDDYSADDRCFGRIMSAGDEVRANLTTSQTIAIGDKLESAGNGKLRKHTADSAGAVEYPESIVAIALEAVTTTSAVDDIHVQIM